MCINLILERRNQKLDNEEEEQNENEETFSEETNHIPYII